PPHTPRPPPESRPSPASPLLSSASPARSLPEPDFVRHHASVLVAYRLIASDLHLAGDDGLDHPLQIALYGGGVFAGHFIGIDLIDVTALYVGNQNDSGGMRRALDRFVFEVDLPWRQEDEY